MERRFVGRRTFVPALAQSQAPAGEGHGRDVEPVLTGSGQCKERARQDCHSAGRVGSYHRGSAKIFPYHHGRSIELRNRQRHGFRDHLERRAARRHRFDDAVPIRRPNSVTMSHVIACIIGARPSRFRIPPGKPIVFTSDTFGTSRDVRRWVTSEGEPNIAAVDDLMDAWRQIGGFATGTRFTLATYCRTGRDGLTIMDRI